MRFFLIWCILFLYHIYPSCLGNQKLQLWSRWTWIQSLISGVFIWERNGGISLRDTGLSMIEHPLQGCGTWREVRLCSESRRLVQSTCSVSLASLSWGGERNPKQLLLLVLQVWGSSPSLPHGKHGCTQGPVIAQGESTPAISNPQNLVPAASYKKVSWSRSCR